MQIDLAFVQAVNDWQVGGDALRKGARLKKALPADLPTRFRSCIVPCYQQEAHPRDRMLSLIACKSLPERIAGWTVDLGVARAFKSGVPPQGLQGVIFEIVPRTEAVVLNLHELYRDREFSDAAERYKSEIQGWHDGIGRYGDQQSEVILELESVSTAEIVSYGGYVGTLDQLAEVDSGPGATENDLNEVARKLKMSGHAPGDEWWLTEQGTRNVLNNMEPHIKEYLARKATGR